MDTIALQDLADDATATELTGKTVITRYHPEGTVTYDGWSRAAGNMLTCGAGGWSIDCHPLNVAPADEAVIRDASDPVAKAHTGAVKYDYKAHAAPSWFRWQATLKGLPVGRCKTKTEALTLARIALAVHEWHDARRHTA